MNNKEYPDILMDFLSETLPYEDVKKLNETITDGQNYSAFLKEFEKKYKTDKNLAREIQLRKDLKKAISEIEDIEDLRKKIEMACQEKKIINFNNKYIKWVAAASFLVFSTIGLVTFLNMDNSDPDKLYSKFYDPYKESETFLKSESDVLKIAKQKYNNGNYGEAIIVLKNAPASINIESEKLFYSGLSYMELCDYNSAIVEFENLLTYYSGSTWANYASWYLGLSYIKTENIFKAKEVFNKMIVNKFRYYEKAKKILKHLK